MFGALVSAAIWWKMPNDEDNSKIDIDWFSALVKFCDTVHCNTAIHRKIAHIIFIIFENCFDAQLVQNYYSGTQSIIYIQAYAFEQIFLNSKNFQFIYFFFHGRDSR